MYKICGKVKSTVFTSNQIWRHNALLGQCKRAITFLQSVYDADTTTDECREMAAKLEGQMMVLDAKLRRRRDQR